MSVIPFLLYVIVTSITPGPNNIMAMAIANKYGFKRSLNFVYGVATGFLLLMLLCSYFTFSLYSYIPKIKFAMSILGSLYMLYLSFKIMKSALHKNDKDDKDNNDGRWNSFFSGMMLQFINFKVILYGITAISSFIIPFYTSHISLILFSFFLAFVGLAATSCWAVFGALFQKFLFKYEKHFNIFMGILLIYSAISLHL
ncbi:LysE family transporter [Paenibacillus mendelii]|uniref:LysE family transporter n=1 Tax=Paenibacillus mendelii TaxID=206163 RepID=A0ABV6JGN4_9BACL|nr:LysE family transporter [Paenibacillus mendelii]MCQ6557971.1 LysE family transporter [Paenibacillus mendelii]